MKHEAEDLNAEQLRAVPITELRRLRDEFAADVALIQAQLGDNLKTHPDGTPMTFKEWNDWRRAAKFALAKKQVVLGRIKSAIKECDSDEFNQRVLGAIRPAARAVLRELLRYEFPADNDAALRRTVLALAEVVFRGEELREFADTVERWVKRPVA